MKAGGTDSALDRGPFREIKAQATHVEAAAESAEDRGSTPLASILRSERVV